MVALSCLCNKSGTRSMILKIVFPGGRVELHDRAILASEIMQKHPKCCVAHPTVFQQPWAVVSAETVLELGKKFYVVPNSTLRKLRTIYRRNCNVPMMASPGEAESDGSSSKSSSAEEVKVGGGETEAGCFKKMIGRSKRGVKEFRNETKISQKSSSPSPTAVNYPWQPSLPIINEEY